MSSQRAAADREAAVRAVVIGGESARAVAARYGVSPASVKRWIDLARAEAERDDAPKQPEPRYGGTARYTGTAREAPAAEEAAPRVILSKIDESKTTLEQARAAWKRSQDLADSAEAVGNFQAAQRAMRDAMSYMLIIARLEKEAAVTGDDLRIPKAQVPELRRKLREMITALGERGPRCVECGIKLAAKWAHENDKPQDAP